MHPRPDTRHPDLPPGTPFPGGIDTCRLRWCLPTGWIIVLEQRFPLQYGASPFSFSNTIASHTFMWSHSYRTNGSPDTTQNAGMGAARAHCSAPWQVRDQKVSLTSQTDTVFTRGRNSLCCSVSNAIPPSEVV